MVRKEAVSQQLQQPNNLMNPLSILSNSLAVLVYIYTVCEAVKENREECRRFCDHANEVLEALQARCVGDLPPNLMHRLISLPR